MTSVDHEPSLSRTAVGATDGHVLSALRAVNQLFSLFLASELAVAVYYTLSAGGTIASPFLIPWALSASLLASSLVAFGLTFAALRQRWGGAAENLHGGPVSILRPRGDGLGILLMPIGLAIAFAGLSSVMMGKIGVSGQPVSTVDVAVVLVLTIGWPLLGLWACVSLLLLLRYHRVSVPTLSRSVTLVGMTHPRHLARVLPTLLITGLFLVWVFNLQPPPGTPFKIDGNMEKWRHVAGHPDPVGDVVAVATDPRITLDYSSTGSYHAALNVTDSGGLSEQTQVQFRVPNLPPAPRFSYAIYGLNVSVNGTTSSDPDGTIKGFIWDFGDGASASGPVANHEYFASGSYTVILAVLDSEGAESLASHSVSVTGPNRPPVPIISYSVLNWTIVVSATASHDPDDGIASVEWQFGDGASSDAMNASHRYAKNGTFIVNLSLTDTRGGMAVTSLAVTVPNAAPTPRFTTETQGLTLICDGSNSTDDTAIVEYTWSFGDGRGGSGPLVRHQYSTSGTYQVLLIVRDNLGYSSSELQYVQVAGSIGSPLPPIPRFGITEVNLTVTFLDNGSYDPDGSIVEYFWEFGDGVSASGPRVDHTYLTAGVYVANFTVVDDSGLSATGSMTVDLSQARRSTIPPVPRIVVRVSGFTVSLDGTLSTATGSTIVHYLWSLANPTSSLDLAEVKVKRDGSQIFVYAQLTGPTFSMSNATSAFTFYFQTPHSHGGVPTGGIFADYAIRVVGRSGEILSSQLLMYSSPGESRVPGRWIAVGTAPVAVSGSFLEAMIFSSDLLVPSDSSLRLTCASEVFGAFADLLSLPISV